MLHRVLASRAALDAPHLCPIQGGRSRLHRRQIIRWQGDDDLGDRGMRDEPRDAPLEDAAAIDLDELFGAIRADARTAPAGGDDCGNAHEVRRHHTVRVVARTRAGQNRRSEGSRAAYQAFFTAWNTADSDLPHLTAGRQEYAAIK